MASSPPPTCPPTTPGSRRPSRPTGSSVERLPCPGDRTAFFMQETRGRPSPYARGFIRPCLTCCSRHLLRGAVWCLAEGRLRGPKPDAEGGRRKGEGQAEQLRRDEARLELEQLAAAGYSAEAIMGEARSVGRPAKEAYVRALVEAFEGGRRQGVLRAASGGGGPPTSSPGEKKKRKDPFEGDPDAYAEALRKAALAKLAKMQGGAPTATRPRRPRSAGSRRSRSRRRGRGGGRKGAPPPTPRSGTTTRPARPCARRSAS